MFGRINFGAKYSLNMELSIQYLTYTFQFLWDYCLHLKSVKCSGNLS